MKNKKYFLVYYLHYLFLILCCIPILGSYFNSSNNNNVHENNKNNRNDYNKFAKIKIKNEERTSKSSWHDREKQTYVDRNVMSPYKYQYRQRGSGKNFPYRYDRDFLGQETNSMDVSNSVWNSNEFDYKNNGNWKKTNKVGGGGKNNLRLYYDVTMGRKNKVTIQKDVDNFVTGIGITDTMNEIPDYSINMKLKHKLKSTMPLRKFNYAKDIVFSKGEQTDRQGLTLVSSVLSSISAPTMSWIIAMSFVFIDLIAMALHTALQLKKSNPTSAPVSPTTCSVWQVTSVITLCNMCGTGESGPTCSEAERYTEFSTSLDNCKAVAISLGYRYIFFQDLSVRPQGVRCHIYISCTNTRTPNTGGTNYEYVC